MNKKIIIVCRMNREIIPIKKKLDNANIRGAHIGLTCSILNIKYKKDTTYVIGNIKQEWFG